MLCSVRFLLCLLKEVDHELLVVLDEVVGQSMGTELPTVIFAPIGVEGFEDGELGGPLAAIDTAGRRHPRVWEGRRAQRRGRVDRGIGRNQGGRAPVAKQTTQQTVLVLGLVVGAAKGGITCGFAGVLLPVVHLLLELSRLFLVDKGESGKALLELKAVEVGAVLVVAPNVVDLLIPNDTSIRGLGWHGVC